MIFITGAASAGKTSAIRLLKEMLPDDKFDIHDIDEADRWAGDYEAWRDAKIEYWLKQSIENKKKGIETILCGIIYPEHVVNAHSYAEAEPVEYILLDATPEAIRERYYKKMEPWLNRQMEISKELRTELAGLENKQVVDTVNASTVEVAQAIVSRINSSEML